MGTEEPQPSSSAEPSPNTEASPIKPKAKEPPLAEDYGKAAYAMSRHRKNKVLVWQSKTLPGRVYEFVLATKFRLPGLCSWKCLQCSLLKQRLRKENRNVLQYKIPLLLVDNDVIKENPDHPNNAAHFCEGRDLIDATVLRTKLVFYDAFSKGNMSAEQRNEAVEAGATTVTPFELTSNEKETIKSMFANEKTVDTMNKVIRKRKNNSGRKKMSPPELEKVDPRSIQPRMPVKRMVKLKNSPAKETSEELKKNSPDKLDVKKIIRQIQEKVEKEKLEEAKLVDANKVEPEPLLTPEKLIELKLKEQYPPEAFAPITPLMICLDPEEGDEAPEEDELIDVEGVDSS